MKRLLNLIRTLTASAFLLIGLTALGAASAAIAAPSTACASIAARIAPARAAFDTTAFAGIWIDAQAATSDCDERAVHCIGNLLSLGQLDIAYHDNADGRDMTALRISVEAGLAYGEPWPVDAALGDLDTADGQAQGSAASYAAAAWHYQEALIGLGEPQVCADFGEAPAPDVAAVGVLYNHLSAALLLADPLQIATTRCAPCEWLFLAGTAGFAPLSRPLPITFPEGSAVPTNSGRAAIDALLLCIKAQGYRKITLSGHTDPSGNPADNLALSKRRLETVHDALTAGGFAGSIELLPRGESQPFAADPGFSESEQWQLDRRIELRATEGPPTPEKGACS